MKKNSTSNVLFQKSMIYYCFKTHRLNKIVNIIQLQYKYYSQWCCTIVKIVLDIITCALQPYNIIIVIYYCSRSETTLWRILVKRHRFFFLIIYNIPFIKNTLYLLTKRIIFCIRVLNIDFNDLAFSIKMYRTVLFPRK